MFNKTEFTPDRLYVATCMFNEIAGNTQTIDLTNFQQQQKVLLEEVNEIQAGIDNNDLAEIVDGVIDTFVVNAGHWQRLELLGVDMQKAAKLIATNNLSKYVSPDDTEEIARTLEMYANKGAPVYTVHDKQYNRVAFKRIDTGKIMKPYSFTSVDISECIPEGLSLK